MFCNVCHSLSNMPCALSADLSPFFRNSQPPFFFFADNQISPWGRSVNTQKVITLEKRVFPDQTLRIRTREPFSLNSTGLIPADRVLSAFFTC